MLFNYPVAHDRFPMQRSILLLSIFWIISASHHLVHLNDQIQPWSPFVLLLGPVLFAMANFNQELSLRRHLPHLIPFALTLLLGTLGFDPSGLERQQQYLLMGLLPLPYLLAILKNNISGGNSAIGRDAVLFTATSMAFSCVWYIAIAFIDQRQHLALGLDLRVFPIGGIAMAMIGFWTCTRSAVNQSLEGPVNEAEPHSLISYQRTSIGKDQMEAYLDMIDQYLVSSQHFLDPLISPEKLACELNIPKHLISMIFNQHIGHRFYTYIALLRISHAKKLIASGSYQQKIDTLAEQCGFNSSTSFYRYFRQQTGLSPYQYILQKETAQKC